MPLALDEVYAMDCVEGLARIAPGSIDLVFADPPFNIGYEYDVYEDRRPAEEYLDWSRKWMAGVKRALKPNGTFWLAIGDEYAADLKVIAQRELGFTCRSWVIWYYTFGVNCTRAFSRSHTHLLYFVSDPADFTFNAENPAVRVPSARQLVYSDGRANPKGRLPDNTWILRPQDVPGGFAPQHDTWYFARVAGTFKEREGFHGCQMPEQLLGRILRCCSNPLDIVLDPFGGSGTTFAVAKKLGRRWIGFEVSPQYVQRIRDRLKRTRVGDPLDGPADPLSSAPKTQGPYRIPQGALRRASNRKAEEGRWSRSTGRPDDYDRGIIAAYLASRRGCSVDHLLADPELNAAFAKACTNRGLPGEIVAWNRDLLRIRKAGKLPSLDTRVRAYTFRQMDAYSFASEIALQQVSVEFATTLDGILCDPALAARFDAIAAAVSPGYTSFEYRWAALAIRKRAKTAKKLAKQRSGEWAAVRLSRATPISASSWRQCDCPGVYLLAAQGRLCLYVGETLSLRQRIGRLAEIPFWGDLGPLCVRATRQEDCPWALQAYLIRRVNPLMNARLLVPDD